MCHSPEDVDSDPGFEGQVFSLKENQMLTAGLDASSRFDVRVKLRCHGKTLFLWS